MKIIFIILLLTIASAQEKAQTPSTPTPTHEVTPIVVNEVENKTQPIGNTSSTDKIQELPKVVKAQFKQSSFDINQPNQLEAHFDKQPATSSLNSQPSADALPSLSPQLSLETQKQSLIQLQKQKQELEDEQSKLQPWIVDQFKTFQQHPDGIVTESFQFVLDPDTNYTFRWNPPKTQMLSINVLIFQILDNGEIMLQHDLEQNEFIEVAMREEGHKTFITLGKTYVSKVFRINFDTDFKYFKFTSHIPKTVFVVVDLQKTQEVIPKENVARDQHFQLPLSKLKAIEQQVESGQKIREHTYKYQWGFLDNQYAHDSRLLGLTGFQLLIIMGAAVVQLYFIKSLLDNRAVV